MVSFDTFAEPVFVESAPFSPFTTLMLPPDEDPVVDEDGLEAELVFPLLSTPATFVASPVDILVSEPVLPPELVVLPFSEVEFVPVEETFVPEVLSLF